MALPFFPDEVRIGQYECIVLLKRALDQQGNGALRRVQAGVRIDTSTSFQMINDNRGIGDAHSFVFNEGQFASRPLARIGRDLEFVWDAGDPQPSLELAQNGLRFGTPNMRGN